MLPRLNRLLQNSNVWQVNNVSDNDTSEESSNDPNISPWIMPDPELIRREIMKLDNDDDSGQAWSSLINFTPRPRKGNPQWWPGDTIFEFLLFCFRFNPHLSITREILQAVIDIFLTLQQQGIITNRIIIPKSAKTIERLLKNLPKVPIS